MLGTNPKSGRWRGWRLPENILVPKGKHHPFTYCPSPKSRSPTVGTTPTQQHREKELGRGGGGSKDNWSMGPHGGKNSSSPFTYGGSPSPETTVQPPSTGLSGLPSQTLKIRAAKGPLTFPRAIPTPLSEPPWRGCREEATESSLQLFHSHRARSSGNFLRDLKRDPQTTGLCSPHSSAHTPHRTYFLSVPRSPAFASLFLKLHTHPSEVLRGGRVLRRRGFL